METSKRILVTGGAGFLGANLCTALMGQGHSVLCVDNLYSGTKSKIAHLMSSPRFEFMQHDITHPLKVRVDQIYNLACPASPVHYQHRPIETTKTCVLGALNMLELALSLNIPILQASTSEVYGDPEEHPQRETYQGNVNPIGPRSCYDEGKRCAESLFFDYKRKHGVNIKVVRIFNTYGPGMLKNDGRVVSQFIINALQNKPLDILGTGHQTRSFCYVDDMIEGIIRMMQTPSAIAGPVNLGNPNEFTINELANLIVELTQSRSLRNHHPRLADDPIQRRPDLSRARDLLWWDPKIKLRDGLQSTIKYFEHLLGE